MMNDTQHFTPQGSKEPRVSGVAVAIVGCGIGGLTTAIECHRNGHSVTVFDRISHVRDTGMVIVMLAAVPIEPGLLYAY